jgi:UDP-N-acetylglucosamine acyltransferase
MSHVSVAGRTQVGENTKIFPFASIGHIPQDLKYRGEKSKLIIGKNNIIREHVTMNPGTEGGGMITQVGDNCLFMVGAHVAHDCRIGNNVIMANNATLGGHVFVDDYAIIGGLAAVHQFVRIGKHAIVGGMSGVENDVIPYGSVIGERASLAGLNLIGLKRRNFDRETIHALRNAYKMLFDADTGTLFERSSRVQEAYTKFPPVQEIIEFMEDKGARSLCTPRAA